MGPRCSLVKLVFLRSFTTTYNTRICSLRAPWSRYRLHRSKLSLPQHVVRLNFPQVPNPRPSSGLTSTSIDRAPGPSNNFVRGKSGYVPFWPGGLEDVAKDPVSITDLNETSEGLKTIPPGFGRGLRFPGDDTEDEMFPELRVTSIDKVDTYSVRALGSIMVILCYIWLRRMAILWILPMRMKSKLYMQTNPVHLI